MKRVGSRELRNHLGRYLRLAASGEDVLVNRRGKPLARLMPARDERGETPLTDEWLRLLAAEGHIRLATKPFRPRKPPLNRGKSLSRILIRDRG